MNDFLPTGYCEPVTSNYTKLVDGDNKFRILSEAVVGMVFWKTVLNENGKPNQKPIRRRPEEPISADEIELDKYGKPRLPKHFWAFVVYNYNDERIQILELTQSGIRRAIKNLINKPKWGDPRDYDITITREGKDLDTEYTVSSDPKEEFDEKIIEQYKAMKIDLEVLYSGGDPFASTSEKTEGQSQSKEDEISIDEIP